MLETGLLWLTAAFVLVAVVSVAGFFVARWVFVQAAERVSETIERRVGRAAAGALTHLDAYARAAGLDLAEADRRFGQHIDRFAHLMDSAVRVPLLGPVGLDVVISAVPVVGDLTAGALSLVLVARSLRYGPPATLVSKMLSNVLTDLIVGAVPVVGVLADIWFRANDRNAALLREYLQQTTSGPRSSWAASPTRSAGRSRRAGR